KLHEDFVKEILKKLPLKGSYFQTLVPVQSQEKSGYYVLLVDRLESPCEDLAESLDTLLQESHRYREARLLGQLDAPRVCEVKDVQDRYLNNAVNGGMTLGNIKHCYLVKEPIQASQWAGWVS